MFGIGTQEILIILALAIIVIGPRKLPEMAASLGRAFSEMRRAMDDLKESAATDLKTTARQEKRLADEEFARKYPDLAEEARRREAEATGGATGNPPAGAPAAEAAPTTSAGEAAATPAAEEELPTYPAESGDQ
jgi:Tat protein translocase TatB subunit